MSDLTMAEKQTPMEQETDASQSNLDTMGRVAILGSIVVAIFFMLVVTHPLGLADMLGEWAFSWFAHPAYLITNDRFRHLVFAGAGLFLYGPIAMAGVFFGMIVAARMLALTPLTRQERRLYFLKRVFFVFAACLALWSLWDNTREVADTFTGPNANQTVTWRWLLLSYIFVGVAWACATGRVLAHIALRLIPATRRQHEELLAARSRDKNQTQVAT
ncbi:MAG: hypothetical protein VYD64_05915 [Pseudomonadota bacterium]|nr:hypothetical protein [Pseudomonadota bacterium]